MYHYRKTRKRYHSFVKDAECDFCNPGERTEPIIRESEHAYVIPNRTFYDQWELRKVIDHAMVIPKRHVLSLSELTREERADIADIAAEYEANGYDVYARSPASTGRSVPHQHTHLIKTEPTVGKGIIHLKRPYILLHLK